jgi:hypothetical protein
MTIRHDSTGALVGTMKSLDQGGTEIAASVRAPRDSMAFVIPSQGISYAGVFTPAGDSIRGTLVRGRSFPLTFVRANAPAPDRRPQDPTGISMMARGTRTSIKLTNKDECLPCLTGNGFRLPSVTRGMERSRG